MVKSPKYRLYPVDEPCPCESGLIYDDCCKSKAFKYELDSRNNVVRSVKIPDELVLMLQKQESDFKGKFGRKPGRHDRIFLETYKRSPDQFDEDFKNAALESGLDRAKVYASWKTGLLPTTGRLDIFTELELDEWTSAVDEYYQLEEDGVDISNFKMAAISGRQIDVDVYTVLFRYMSRFVHPNVDMIGRNFSQEKGFSIHFEHNPFEGLIISSFTALLLFSEMSKLNCFRKIQRRDARFLAKRIAKALKKLGSGSIEIFSGPFVCLKAKVDDIVIELDGA
jgi:hypothetical protein